MNKLRDIDDMEAGTKLADTAVRREVPERAKRPVFERMEFDLPRAVKLRLKTEAARNNTSANRILLGILQGAGYPVSDADLVDGRKGRRA